MRSLSPCLVLLFLVACGSVAYNDPVNPKNPYMFPGQAPTSPGVASTQPASPEAPKPAPDAVAPAPTAAPPVTPATAPTQPIPAQPLVAQPAQPAVSPATPAPTLPTTPMPAPAPPIPVTPVTPALPASTIGSQDSQTVFRPGDSLVVSFSDLPAPGLQPVNIDLGPDGKITLHHNVQVYALGKTARGLEQEIRSEYVPKYYKYLTVTIKTEMRFFHVNGEVKIPAMYPWRGEMTVLRAIGQAGGFTDWSKKKKVQLTHANGQKFTVNCEKAQMDPVLDLPVYPGDYINVPKKGPLGF